MLNNIFLINLDTRPDRLSYVTLQMNNLGLSFQRVSAVNGKKLSPEECQLFDTKRFILEQKKKPVVGEIGCAMSHRCIWQKILDDNLDYALILEDDIYLDERLPQFLNLSVYNDFDFLNLSAFEPYKVDNNTLSLFRERNITQRPYKWQSRKLWKTLEWRRKWRIFNLKFVDEFTVCECDTAPALGSGYILSNKGAKALLNTSQKMFYPVDVTWRYSGGMLKQGFLSEPLITQKLGDTNIEGRYVGYKLNLLQRIQRMFVKSRRIRRRLDVAKMYGWSKL